MSARTRTSTGLIAVACAIGLTATGVPLAGPAAARTVGSARVAAGTSGSIVFVKGWNLFIARGDGTHVRRVTSGGTKTHPYHSPSESDDGTIAAANGKYIVRLTQRGKLLNRIDAPALRDSADDRLDGAVNDVSISPNGRTVAWSFVRYTCPVAADCLVRFATGYTASWRYKSVGRRTYFRAPSWVTNTRTIQTGGFGSQVMIQDITHTPVHWFDDRDYAFPSEDLADGEVSPDGRWVAQVRGFKASSAIAWYRVRGNVRSGPAPSFPEITCLTNGNSKHASPTWSPDSTALAWTSSDGIWIQRDAADCAAPRLAIKGAKSPDWSKAPLR